MSKITVIIPIYQAYNTLERSVNSLIHSMDVIKEIFLIDDGSEDGSREKIQMLADKYPQIIYPIYQEHRGVAAARNAGLSKATGSYILFLDSDDYLEENSLPLLLSYAEKRQIDVLRFALQYEYPDGTFRREKVHFVPRKIITKEEFPSEIYWKMLTGIQMNSVCHTLYKRAIIQDVFFDENMKTAEDLLFSMEVLTRANTFCYIDDTIYHYWQSREGLTGKGLSVWEKYRCNWQVSKALITYLPQWNMNRFYPKTLAVLRMALITVHKIKQ